MGRQLRVPAWLPYKFRRFIQKGRVSLFGFAPLEPEQARWAEKVFRQVIHPHPTGTAANDYFVLEVDRWNDLEPHLAFLKVRDDHLGDNDG